LDRPIATTRAPGRACLRFLPLALLLIAGSAHGAPAADATATPGLPAGVTAKAVPEPALTAEEEARRFNVAPGFRVELVAAEPLVESPVAIAFDADGRLWVVEMRGFMRDADGHGEEEPVGQVAILEDSDGDGRMDRRKVFLDGLVLPRSLAFAGGGVLVAAPPELIFCKDADHDDRCDQRQVLSQSYGTRKNPEHDANGLLLAIDNWLYSANLGLRHRVVGGKLITEPTVTRGQWGISQDDVGRLFYNTNSDYLRADLVPAFTAAAHVRGGKGLNLVIDEDQTLWPARPNTGVNRGYQDGNLRPDGTLKRFTAACGPVIYRGDHFPAEFRGNAFVAEPAANLVRRSVIVAGNGAAGGTLAAHNAESGKEFLTSTDERFRPVNLVSGPDGALYVVDMYRGIIQHRIYLTKFLRAQIVERGLEAPVDRGRIWRVVRTDRPLGPRPKLQHASDVALVGHLAHPNGWWRDTAQRLLVERLAVGVSRPLARLAYAKDPRTRLHALFALDGVGQANPALVATAAADKDPFVAAAGKALRERDEVATLGKLAGQLAARPSLEGARLPGVRGRELTLLGRLLMEPAFAAEAPGRAAFIRALAAKVAGAGDAEATGALLGLAVGEPREAAWRQVALLQAVASARRPAAAKVPRPEGWSRVARSQDPAVQKHAEALEGLLSGEPAGRPRGVRPARPLSGDEQARFARGKALYPGICGACHQPSGLGEEGKGPPLVDSGWVLGPPERIVRIALHGLRGPVKVGSRTFQMEMPAMGALEDAQLAELITYVRNEREWGHDAPAIDAGLVARVRKATASREQPWTVEELLEVP
jgi:glucose/arabinose dehydrogenase/mono/diheme cytochrome c family protein